MSRQARRALGADRGLCGRSSVLSQFRGPSPNTRHDEARERPCYAGRRTFRSSSLRLGLACFPRRRARFQKTLPTVRWLSTIPACTESRARPTVGAPFMTSFLQKIRACALATTLAGALAGVVGQVRIIVRDLHHHRNPLEAIMPSGGHDDDDPGSASPPDLRELRPVTQPSGSPTPFRQNDWPLPARPKPNNQAWAPPRSLALLAAATA